MEFKLVQAVLALLVPAALSVDITSDRSTKSDCVCLTVLELVVYPRGIMIWSADNQRSVPLSPRSLS